MERRDASVADHVASGLHQASRCLEVGDRSAAAHPQHVWDHAQHHGGPGHPPAQTDATVHYLTADRRGTVTIGRKLAFRVGTGHAGQPITVIRDLDRITAYTSDGHPIGYIHLDHTKHYQSTLTPAA